MPDKSDNERSYDERIRDLQMQDRAHEISEGHHLPSSKPQGDVAELMAREKCAGSTGTLADIAHKAKSAPRDG